MLKDHFCSSPWFHLRVTYDGSFEECRWFKNPRSDANLATTSIMEFYNHDRMRSLRSDLLDGKSVAGCSSCYYEDKFDKVSGRKRQLLKSAIDVDNFALTARSSPHYAEFAHSQTTQGKSRYHIADLQIDLGNICNSACIMCDPKSSSRLEQDYIQLHKFNPAQFARPEHYRSWTRDTETVKRFVQEVANFKDLKYIHFLGGETLYDPAFYNICEQLIESGISQNVIVGTTTNGTIYDARVEGLIKQFKEFHLGISIESVTELNDYIRYPGKIAEIKANLDRFLKLREDSKLYISLRITPNVFTISQLDQLFAYMIENNVIAESCNILYKPECLRIELMPPEIRTAVLDRFETLIEQYQLSKTNHVNIRRSDLISDVVANNIIEYRDLIKNYVVPNNADQLRTQLVSFVKSFETVRNNSILDYLPEYEQFLRAYGY
jgi:sulfatase maturation enzyme AslB (radical SAM superfamily)